MPPERRNNNGRSLESKVSALEILAEANARNIEMLGDYLRQSIRETHEQIERLARATHKDIAGLANRFTRSQRPNWQAISVLVIVMAGLMGTVLLPLNQHLARVDEALKTVNGVVQKNVADTTETEKNLVAKTEQINEIETRIAWAHDVANFRALRNETALAMLWNKLTPDMPMPPLADVTVGPGARRHDPHD